MKALARRIQRLQSQLSVQPDLNEYRALCTLYERRRWRFEAAGLPFDEPPPEMRIGPSRQLLPNEIAEARRKGRLAREAREAAVRALSHDGIATDNRT